MLSPYNLSTTMSIFRSALKDTCSIVLDILPSLLGDIIELVTPPPDQRGWLIQDFLRIFGAEFNKTYFL
jgi:hypothetical protein